jgi:membrane protein DedA with SNARE-associated domain
MIAFLAREGALVLFALVLVEQLGLPLPAVPVLLAMGALAATGHVSLAWGLLLAVVACLLADSVWYALGRRHGARVLSLLCRISLEPDSCVRGAQNVLAARGPRALLFAKFVPGLSTVAPPVAGLIRMRPSRFLAWDTAGSLLWAGTWMGVGFAVGPQIERMFDAVSGLGSWVLAAVLAGAAGYVAWKYVQRRRFLRQILGDRVTAEELRRKIESGDDVLVVDLRHAVDGGPGALTVAGARRVAPDALDEVLAGVPPDREVVLFCT